MKMVPINIWVFFLRKVSFSLDDSDFGKGDEVEHICFGQKRHPRCGLILHAAGLGVCILH